MDKDRIIIQYSIDKLSMKKIGELNSVSAQTIMRIIHRNNIPINIRTSSWNSGKTYLDDDRILAKDRHPRIKNKTYYNSDFKRMRKKLLPSVCNICIKQASQIHHKDGDKMNNDINNLQQLCRGCHTSLHNKERGRIKTYFCCKNCKKEFYIESDRRVRKFCSLSCKSSYFYHIVQSSPIYHKNSIHY